jgi:hypothetical protein
MTRDHKATHPTRTGILDVVRPNGGNPFALTPSPGTCCLTVLDTLSLHDGEPVFGWRWDEGTGGRSVACTAARTPMGQTDKRKATAGNMTGAAPRPARTAKPLRS